MITTGSMRLKLEGRKSYISARCNFARNFDNKCSLNTIAYQHTKKGARTRPVNGSSCNYLQYVSAKFSLHYFLFVGTKIPPYCEGRRVRQFRADKRQEWLNTEIVTSAFIRLICSILTVVSTNYPYYDCWPVSMTQSWLNASAVQLVGWWNFLHWIHNFQIFKQTCLKQCYLGV